MGNRSSSQSLSALYQAARNGDDALLQLLMSQEIDDNRRRVLIEWRDVKGRTPLIIASQKGHLGCVLKLLHQSADVHHISKRDFGGTALHEAVYYKWRSNGIVEALLSHGANPFVKNAHNRTVLQLALIENAAKDLFVPWLITFDRYGYFAEEIMVREFTGEETVWRSRWVTVVPLYATSDPRYMRCLKKTLMIYDGYLTRTLLSSIDLSGARAAEQNMITFLKLDAGQSQPSGLAASRLNGSWVIALKATNDNLTARMQRFITVVNEETETVIEQHFIRTTAEHDNNIVNTCCDAGQQNQHAGEHGIGGIPARPATLYPRERHLSTTTGHDDQNTNAAAVSTFTAQGAYANGMGNCNGVAGPPVPGDSRGPDGNNINDDVCVVCLDRPQNAGFVHGNSQHICACHSCAYLIYLSDRSGCPICRKPIDYIAEYDASHGDN